MNNVATEQAHLAQLAAADSHKRFRKLYRLVSNPLWLEAARDAIRTNKGFHTPGVDGLKGCDLDTARLQRLADMLRKGTYEPKPVRRTFVPKRHGKFRPLGLPSAEDKVVQSAIKLVLEPIYEQAFRDCSHGFRPRRSCHTALRAYALRRPPTWTIEGDIERCFDRLSHGLILRLLRQKIADERLIELVRKFLKAGYLQDWQWHATWSGSPQGHVLSPLVANVVLHELDCSVEDVLGANRPKDAGYARRNPAYNRLNLQVNRRSRRLAHEADPQKRVQLRDELQQLKAQRARTPSMRAERSITYVRYCDDWVLALHGYSKDKARAMAAQLAQWLHTHLQLKLNTEKTLITHWSDRVRFLGFELRGVKAEANGVSRVPRLLIPHDAEQRIRHEVARLTRQTSIEPGDMITAINLEQGEADPARRAALQSDLRMWNQRILQTPVFDDDDPAYTRVKFLRYADDIAVGVIGPKALADHIQEEIAIFLRQELKLELNREKTRVIHVPTEKARFVGYEFKAASSRLRRRNLRRTGSSHNVVQTVRTNTGNIKLLVPLRDLSQKLRKYTAKGKPTHLSGLVNQPIDHIIAYYNGVMRGWYHSYQLAENVGRLNQARYVLRYS